MFGRLLLAVVSLGAGTNFVYAQGVILQDNVGVAMVNSGKGFFPAANNMELAPSDRVFVQLHGLVFLVYPDGCRAKLKPGRVVTVGSKTCAPMREWADLPDRAAPPEAPAVPAPPATAAGAIGVVPIIGGVALAGGIAAAVVLTNRGSGNGSISLPISP